MEFVMPHQECNQRLTDKHHFKTFLGKYAINFSSSWRCRRLYPARPWKKFISWVKPKAARPQQWSPENFGPIILSSDPITATQQPLPKSAIFSHVPADPYEGITPDNDADIAVDALGELVGDCMVVVLSLWISLLKSPYSHGWSLRVLHWLKRVYMVYWHPVLPLIKRSCSHLLGDLICQFCVGTLLWFILV